MIGLFGFIKKELKDMGKLPAKFGGWMNTLYLGLDEFKEAVIPEDTNRKNLSYFLFSPQDQECPVDLSAKDWSCSIRVITQSTIKNTSDNHQCAINIISSSAVRTVSVKINLGTEFGFNEYESTGSAHNLNLAKTVKVGDNYLKLDYAASTKTMTASYSFNGSSWTKLGSYVVKKPENMKKVVVLQGHPEATIPVDGIKFIYGGEILFG